MSPGGPDNAELAELLERVAALLEGQDANAFRVRAYRRAAEAVRREARPLAERLAEGGPEALEAVPGVGPGIASLLAEYAHTGRSALLARLEGEVSPEALFATLPGLGPELAARIHRELELETLEELELAAHDGRLERVPGFGPRRARMVRDALASRLSRSARRHKRRLRAEAAAEPGKDEPDAATLLDVDAEYRRRAEAGELRRIAPRRFNPSGEAWLPVLHTERGDWSFTALYSNSARAHELGRTRDWVVIYFERDGREDQCTVVTETRGPRAGRRVVRGRESEGDAPA